MQPELTCNNHRITDVIIYKSLYIEYRKEYDCNTASNVHTYVCSYIYTREGNYCQKQEAICFAMWVIRASDGRPKGLLAPMGIQVNVKA